MIGDREISDLDGEPTPPDAPASRRRVIRWLRGNLFDGVADSLLTIVVASVIVLLAFFLVRFLVDWAIFNGVWNAGSLNECRQLISAAHGKGARGACWAVFNGRIGVLVFGGYPRELYWRPILAFVLLCVALVPMLFRSLPRRLLWFSAIYPIIAFALIWGIDGQTNEELVRELAAEAGIDSSTPEGMEAAWSAFSSTRFTHLGAVQTRRLGGFLQIIALAVTSFSVALPIGIALALGSQSPMIMFRVLFGALLGVFRGVPLYVLFFGTFWFIALAFSPIRYVDYFMRAAFILALPTTVYIAQALRCGLATVPPGQYEEAAALGLKYWKTTRLVVRPQALKVSGPQIAYTAVGLFRNTSVILFWSFLSPVRFLERNPRVENWNGIFLEPLLVMVLFYWVFCFSISRYARYLDRKLKADRRNGLNQPVAAFDAD
jgi:general L-amino acid transport system permease protein